VNPEPKRDNSSRQPGSSNQPLSNLRNDSKKSLNSA